MHFVHALRRTAALAVIAAAIGFAAPGYAQQPTAASLALGKEIVALSGATSLFTPVIAGVVEQSKIVFLQQNPGLAKDLNDAAVKVRNDFAPRFDEITAEVARIYASQFSEAELKEIVAFYKTPTGAKLLSVQPKIVEETLTFAQTWASKLADEAVLKLRDELRKKGHQL